MAMTDPESSNRAGSNLLALAKGVLVNIGGKTFGRSVYVINQVILARTLGPDKYGLYGIGWIFFRIASIISTLGLDSGVIHHTTDFWEREKRRYSEIVISAFLSSFVIGCVIGLFVYLFSAEIADLFRKPDLGTVLQIFAFSIPFMSGLTIVSAATRVTKDMRRSNFIEEIIFPCLMALLIGIVIWIGGDLNGFVLGSTLAVILSLLLAINISSSALLTFRIDWKNIFNHVKKLVSYSLPITLPVLFGTLINLVDRVLTGYFLPEFDTGIYQSVSLVSALFVAILSAFKTMAAPMLAESYHNQNTDELKDVMRASTRWVFILCAPIFIALFLAPNEFIGFILGENYIMGTQAMLVLATAQLINIAKGPVDQLLIMTGNQKKWLVTTLISLVINLASNLVLIPALGIIGAALSQVLAYLVLAIGGIAITWKQLKILYFDRRWFINLIMAGVTMITVYGLRVALPFEALANLIITCIVTGILFLALVVLFGLTKREKDTLKTFALFSSE